MAAEPQPIFSVYRVRDRSVVCFRAVSNNPVQVGDFLTFADLGVNFEWWDTPRAIGFSAWTEEGKARALARRKGQPWVAKLDLAQADPMTPWAFTGAPGHVTIWAPALVAIPAVVNYLQV
jgi:hypothetical protein